MATSIDGNAADGNSDKRNIRLINADYTSIIHKTKCSGKSSLNIKIIISIRTLLFEAWGKILAVLPLLSQNGFVMKLL